MCVCIHAKIPAPMGCNSVSLLIGQGIQPCRESFSKIPFASARTRQKKSPAAGGTLLDRFFLWSVT